MATKTAWEVNRMMQRGKWILAATLVWLHACARAAPAQYVVNDISPKLSVTTSLRLRGEFHNFFEPSDTSNNDYAFGGSVLRTGVWWKDSWFDLGVEAQNSALFGLPDDAVAPAPQ
jgi:hypothetical protein